MRTHKHTHKHTHTCAHTYMLKHIHTHAHTREHTRTLKHTHPHTLIHAHTRTHLHTHKHTSTLSNYAFSRKFFIHNKLHCLTAYLRNSTSKTCAHAFVAWMVLCVCFVTCRYSHSTSECVCAHVCVFVCVCHHLYVCASAHERVCVSVCVHAYNFQFFCLFFKMSKHFHKSGNCHL